MLVTSRAGRRVCRRPEPVSGGVTVPERDLNTAPEIPRREYAERRQAARMAARARGLDGLLMWSMGGSTLDRYANVFYLTNHYDSGNVFPDTDGLYQGFGMAAVVLPVEGSAILVVNQPDWRSDLVECDEVRACAILYDGVAQAIADSGLEGASIGLTDLERMPVAAHSALCGSRRVRR